MASEAFQNSTSKVFVLPMNDFPIYYLPKSHEIVSGVIPLEHAEKSSESGESFPDGRESDSEGRAE